MAKYIERLEKYGIFGVSEEILAAILKFLVQNLRLVM